MMLVPNRDFDLFDDIFGDPFFRKSESKMMKTDIREDKDNYVIDNNGIGYKINASANTMIKRILKLILQMVI